MKHLTDKQDKVLKRVAVVVLFLLCIGELVWFIHSVEQFYRAGDLEPVHVMVRVPSSPENPTATAQVRPVTVTVSSIKSWMTFNYLTVVFKLPPLYLKNALGITDARYPNVRIDSYIRQHRLNAAFFMQNVQKAITSYSYTK